LPELRGIVEWEERECTRISEDRQLRDTEKQALIKARRGQGLFRQKVAHVERFCRVTRVDRPEHLIAGHIKPWRESDNRERLFEGNGLLLTPTIDHLFDRGFISFENNGELLTSPVAHEESLNKMGVITNRVVNVGGFAEPQREFLEFHRSKVFLKRKMSA
jgi:putative restriction endonuclease